jgi:hypothetical protein
MTVWRGRRRPRLLNLVLILSHPKKDAARAFVALPTRASAPAPHCTCATLHLHFANTMACGARFVVAVMVLLGSPPVSWLITNLVMFLEF